MKIHVSYKTLKSEHQWNFYSAENWNISNFIASANMFFLYVITLPFLPKMEKPLP